MTVRAGDIMVREVICVPADMDLRDVAKLFLGKGITGAPVVDEDGDLVGVISQRDVLFHHLTRDDELTLETDFYHQVRVEGHRIGRGYQIEDTNSGRVSDAMTPVVHSVSEAAALETVADLMIRMHIHRVIVRKGRKVVGIISALELLRILGRRGSPARKRAAAKLKPKSKSKAKPLLKAKPKPKVRRRSAA